MRHEDWADVGEQVDETMLDLTPEQADRLRAEYEADEAAKVARRREERAQWNAAAAIARRRMTDLSAAELAGDLAWARSVLVEGETFRDGAALFLALYNAKKASVARPLTFSETNRLRRVLVALWPDGSREMAVSAGQTLEPALSEVA